MTPADRRIAELIDKWLVSVDLHLQYVELSDAAYARVQPWPKHDRPTRWVLEVARQKILELKEHWETRQAIGDSKFSESLELMAFLANLVGIQHIQRFIPLADPARADSAASSVMPQPAAAAVPPPAPPRAPPQNTAPARAPRLQTDDSTREMPRLKPAAARPAAAPARPAAPAKAAPAAKPRSEPAKTPARAAPATARAAAARTATGKAAATTAPRSAPSADLQGKIIADAVRLLKWGRAWHELADLIARIAERPPANEIRKVLRAHRGEIEQRAAAKS